MINAELKGKNLGGQQQMPMPSMGGDMAGINARFNELMMEMRRIETECNQQLIILKKEMQAMGKEDCAFMCKHLCGYSCATGNK